MPLPKEQAWFAAKSYGWGWALPLRWQGWVALVAYLAGLLLSGVTLAAKNRTAAFLLAAFVLSGLLLAICWWKGERPSWRWGDSE